MGNFNKSGIARVGLLAAVALIFSESALIHSSRADSPALYCITTQLPAKSECPKNCTALIEETQDPKFECNDSFGAARDRKLLCRCPFMPAPTASYKVGDPIRSNADLPANKRLAAERAGPAEQGRPVTNPEDSRLAAARSKQAKAAQAREKAQLDLDAAFPEDNKAPLQARLKSAHQAEEAAKREVAKVKTRIAAEAQAKAKVAQAREAEVAKAKASIADAATAIADKATALAAQQAAKDTGSKSKAKSAASSGESGAAAAAAIDSPAVKMSRPELKKASEETLAAAAQARDAADKAKAAADAAKGDAKRASKARLEAAKLEVQATEKELAAAKAKSAYKDFDEEFAANRKDMNSKSRKKREAAMDTAASATRVAKEARDDVADKQAQMDQAVAALKKQEGLGPKPATVAAPSGSTPDSAPPRRGPFQGLAERNTVRFTDENGASVSRIRNGDSASTTTVSAPLQDGTKDITVERADGASATFNVADGDKKMTGRLDSYQTVESGEYIDFRDHADQSDTDCSISSKLGHGCKATRAVVETSKIANVVGQTVGSVATSVAGQSAQQDAMEQGTQAAALRGAASTQRLSGKIQVTTGLSNALMGVVQLTQSAVHSKAGSRIAADTAAAKVRNQNAGAGVGRDGTWSMDKQGQASGQNSDSYAGSDYHGYMTAKGVAGKAIEAFNLNQDYNKELRAVDGKLHHTPAQIEALVRKNCGADAVCGQKARVAFQAEEANYQTQVLLRERDEQEKAGRLKNKVRSIGIAGQQEQGNMASEALGGGMMSLVSGITQGINGAFNLKAANQLEDAARKLEKLQNMAPPVPAFTPLPPGNVGPEDAFAPGSGQALNPGTGTNSAATDATEEAPLEFGNLGDPTGTVQPSDPLPGPPGGEFTAGNGPSGGGSGGGLGGVGGASTSPSSGDNSEPQAKMVEQGRTPNYESGGGTFAAGGGGGGGADRGPDLSGLLAQFLPQKEDQAAKGNGILDFGSRGLASEAPISLLDRNANIFDRIHETYQEKNRRGRVGL